ncbi:ZIP family metal transporter [Aquicella lusitana]|uniref:Zinc transporter ZupT n=1 Tax=Aquicella lusitana TaxID=254246 RepID=A0A370G5W7_9COXI|nr:ZIP family metal transporter [Aquicella lusitana]RDI39202.1 zinc transporter ZupT [Aquicella lusitana]VVC74061.1 hypothetical protein AQULUS_18240 [Aquicella lusitana]
MTLIIFKTIAAVIIFLISVAAVIYPLKTKQEIAPAKLLELGEALASGIFLGVAFFHLLPISISVFHEFFDTVEYPVPEAICMGGFLLLLFLERLSLARSFLQPTHSIPVLLAIVLVIHALTEGAALGIGENISDSLAILIAIIAHKGAASIALCMVLMRYNQAYSRTLLIVILFALMTPIGIAAGTAVEVNTHGREFWIAAFNAFAAGTFIYMSTIHQAQFHQRTEEEAYSMKEFVLFALGLIGMGVLALWT